MNKISQVLLEDWKEFRPAFVFVGAITCGVAQVFILIVGIVHFLLLNELDKIFRPGQYKFAFICNRIIIVEVIIGILYYVYTVYKRSR